MGGMGGGGRCSPQGRRVILYSAPGGDDFGCGALLLYFSFLHSLVRGARTPRSAHSALPRSEDFFN
jgi:hypothetical protein